MESQCDYFMYFPAVPFAARELLAGEPGRYRALPRRNHLYLGETVRFLLVLRCRPGHGGAAGPPWAELAASLAALASVSPGGAERDGAGDGERDGAGAGAGAGTGCPAEPPLFRDCRALLTHGRGPPGRAAAGVAPRGGPHRVPGRGDFPPHHLPGQAAPRHPQGQGGGDRVAAGRGAPRAAGRQRLPGAAAGAGARPRLPPGAGGLQGAGEHPADGAAAARGALPPAHRVREVPHRAQSAERVVAGGDLAAGRAHPAQLQRQLPARHARRLRAAGGRRLPPLRGGARGRLLPPERRRLGLSLRPQRPGGAQLPLPAPGPRETPRGRQGGPGGPAGGRDPVVNTQTALHQQHLHPLPAAQHPPGAAALRDDRGLRVAGAGPAALHRHLHPAQRPPGLPGRQAGLDPRNRHGREEAVGGGAPRHAGRAGRHRVPHAAQQPGLLAQGQRPHHPRGLPGPSRRAVRAVPAHEAEAPVHGQRVQPAPRGPARVPQEQPQQPGRAGPGGAAPGRAGPLPVLLPPAAGPQPPHEVGQRDGASRHHPAGGFPRGAPPLPAPREDGAGAGQDRQAGVQGAGGGARQVTPRTGGRTDARTAPAPLPPPGPELDFLGVGCEKRGRWGEGQAGLGLSPPGLNPPGLHPQG